jgi:hypothetical protein
MSMVSCTDEDSSGFTGIRDPPDDLFEFLRSRLTAQHPRVQDQQLSKRVCTCDKLLHANEAAGPRGGVQ